MTTELFAADVSYWQVPVDDSYNRRWLIFRGGDGSVDDNARENLDWCERAKADGRLYGYTIYWVYRPGDVDNILRFCDDLGAPDDCHMMIDCESWGGQIGGNRSRELNRLARKLRKRQGGQGWRVWGYGNTPDLHHLWPSRHRWMRLVVAGWSTNKPDFRRMVGWQYTDGEPRFPVRPGWPRSSAPFGRCDHNRLYLSEEDMTMGLSRKDIDRIARAVLTTDGVIPSPRGSGGNKFWTLNSYVRSIRRHVVAGQGDVRGNARLLADLTKRVAALQAEVADLKTTQAHVEIHPTDVPVTGTVHIGGEQ